MNPDDRALAIGHLLARQRSLAETVAGLSAERWSFRAAE